MNTLITAITIIHVVAGTVALLAGLIPMFSQKGNRLHNRTGRLYVWCMIIVAGTALLMCGLQPFKMLRLFLTGIAVLSFYLCVTGWRAIKQKKSGPALTDKLLTYVTLVVSVAMMGFGAYLMALNGATFFPILFVFFGGLTFSFARQDYRQFNRSSEKMHWFFQHFTRMGGSYIATFTAFLVNNMTRIVPADAPEWIGLAGWIAPSVIGGMLIGRTVAYYKQRSSASKATLI